VKAVPQVVENIEMIAKVRSDSAGVADPGTDARLSTQALRGDDNPALQAWRDSQ